MKKTYLATAVAALFAAPITTAIAADTLLDDVVVSSSRSEQRSFDAPGSIQSVGKEVIQSAGPQVNLSEALASVPGVTILNRQNYAQDLQVSIRGFGARTKFGVRGVRLIIDGIPATIPDGQGQSSSISLTSTDRIEVLRGPIAQLYGNSAGGVIQAFTREAPEQPELQIQGYLGSYGANRTDWQYAQKVGQFGFVADYSTFKTDGFRLNSQTERNQFNGKLTYQHDDKTKVNLIANIFDMPYAYDPKGLNWSDAQIRPDYSTNVASTTVQNRRYRKMIKQEQLGLVGEHQINSDSKVKVYGYVGHRENTHINAGAAFVGLDRDYYGFGAEFQTRAKLFDKPAAFVVGSNYDKTTEINNRGSITATGEIDNPYLYRKEDRLAQNMDFYGQSTIQAFDKISLTGGFRSTEVKLSSFDMLTNTDYGSTRYKSINPVLGATYYAQDNLNLYFNWGKGFETPTLTEVSYINDASPPTAISGGFNKNLIASKSSHYETGLKWLPSSQSRVDLSIFYIKTHNEIVPDYVDGINASYKNIAGGTTRKGVEFSAQSFLNKFLKSNLSATYLDASFDQSFNALNSTTSSVNSGYKIPGTSPAQLYAQLVFSNTEFRRNKYKQVLGSTITAEVFSSGKIYVLDNNNYLASGRAMYAPGYSTYNIKLAHRWDVENLTFSAAAHINNLTDKKYIGSVIVGDSSAPYEPAPGRNWMVGLNATARF